MCSVGRKRNFDDDLFVPPFSRYTPFRERKATCVYTGPNGHKDLKIDPPEYQDDKTAFVVAPTAPVCLPDRAFWVSGVHWKDSWDGGHDAEPTFDKRRYQGNGTPVHAFATQSAPTTADRAKKIIDAW